MWKAKPKIVLLIALLFLTTGCSMFGSIEWEWKGPRTNVSGKVSLRDLGAPLTAARIFFNGPVDRSVTTRRSGAYSIDLPAGTYDVTVRTLHDDYKTQVRVSGGGAEVIDLPFWTKSWFDKATFFSLSGIRRWYFEGGRLVYSDDGELARWEQPRVRIFFDGSYLPPSYAEQLAKSYFSHIRGTWRSLLKDTIAFERVYSRNGADVEVRWVPPGHLTDREGYRVAAQSFFYWQDGSLRKVIIEIDEEWATEPGLWEHEWARAMGIGYTDDPNSLMYPELRASQRRSFASWEARHVQLIYDLPSGLSRSQVWSLTAETDGEEDGAAAELAMGIGTGYGGHARRVDGQVVVIDPFEAADKIFGW